MIRKSLEIIRCSQCYRCETIHPREPWEEGNYYCMHEQALFNMTHHSDAPLSNKLDQIHTIPDWCPLEDWPEE